MELKDKYLKKLKCSVCKSYLSCFPVMINRDGNSICGKCHQKNPTTHTIRNKAYEEVAKGILFPCGYHNEGCSNKFLVEDLEKHEETCRFRTFPCPTNQIQDGCSWKGSLDKCMTHCLDTHAEMVVNQPHEQHLNLIRQEPNSYLTFIFGYIFLFQIKCSMLHDKIVHSVQLFGDSALKSLFKYSFELESSDGAMKKIFNIQDYGTSWQETKISNLVTILGNLNNITMRFTIKMNEENCAKCTKKLIYPVHREGQFYCIDCTTKSSLIDKSSGAMVCLNKANGCNFQCETYSNLLKHERWFCECSSLKCKWGCGAKLTDVNRFQHCITNYLPLEKCLGYNNEIGKTYTALMIAYDVQFLCKWTLRRTSDTMLCTYIVTDQPADEIKNYSCSVEITYSNLENDTNSFTKTAHVCTWKDRTSNWDYSVECRCKDVEKYNLLLKIEKVAQ